MIAAYLMCVGLGCVPQAAPLTVPQLFAELRLSPEHLVAAGVPPESLPGMVEGIAESEAMLDAVVMLQAEHAAVSSSIDALAASEVNDPEVSAALVDAIASRQLLEAEVKAAWESLYVSMAVVLDSPARERLLCLRNSALSPLPTQFRVVNLNSEVERILAIALRQEQRVLLVGGDLDEALANALAIMRSNPEVTAASSRLESGVAAMKAAMVQAGAAPSAE